VYQFDVIYAISLKINVSAKFGKKKWKGKLEVRFIYKLFKIFILVVQNPVRYVDELERVQRQRRQQQQQQQNSEVEIVWGRNLNFYLIKNFNFRRSFLFGSEPSCGLS